MKTRRVEVQGAAVTVREWGDEGIPLLYWHGLNPFGALELIEAGPAWAAEGFLVVAFAAPGIGIRPRTRRIRPVAASRWTPAPLITPDSGLVSRGPLGNVVAFERLDVLGVVGLHALEDDERPVPPADLRFEHVERAAKVEFGDLVDQELAHRFPDRVLHFADAD